VLIKNETLRQKRNFNFYIENFPFIYSNFPAVRAYGIFIFELTWNSSHWGNCQDVHYFWMLQGFLVIKLKSSLRKFNGCRHCLDIEYLCHRLRFL